MEVPLRSKVGEMVHTALYELKIGTTSSVPYSVKWAWHPYVGFPDPAHSDSTSPDFQLFRRAVMVFTSGTVVIEYDKLGNLSVTGPTSDLGTIVSIAYDTPYTIGQLDSDVNDMMFSPSLIIAPFTDGLMQQTWYCSGQNLPCDPSYKCGWDYHYDGIVPQPFSDTFGLSPVGFGVSRPYIQIADSVLIHETPPIYPVAYRNWFAGSFQSDSRPDSSFCNLTTWEFAGLSGTLIGWMEKMATRLHDIPAYVDVWANSAHVATSCSSHGAITAPVIFNFDSSPELLGYREIRPGGTCP